MITAAILICLSPVATDGDTFKCGTSPARIRPFGVNAVEKGTVGSVEATAGLQALINGGVICEPVGASFSRTVAICRNSAGIDVGKAQLDNHQVKEWCSYSVSRSYPAGYYGTCVKPVK